MKTQVIILAGGKGTRMKASVNKTLLLISGIPVIIRSINAFIPYADSIVIAAPPDEQPIIRRLLEQYDISFPVQFTDGGHTRQESVLNCLQILSYQSDDTILIHDAARCLVKADLIERVIHSVQKTGSGIPGIPVNRRSVIRMALSSIHRCDRVCMRYRLLRDLKPDSLSRFH